MVAMQGVIQDPLSHYASSRNDEDKRKALSTLLPYSHNKDARVFRVSSKNVEEKLSIGLQHENAQLHESMLNSDRFSLQHLTGLENMKHESLQKELQEGKHTIEVCMPTNLIETHGGEKETVHLSQKLINEDVKHIDDAELDSLKPSLERDPSMNRNAIESNKHKMQKKLMMQAKSEILKLVKKQDLKWIKAEDAVENLERRLKLLEDKKVKVEEIVERKLLDSGLRGDIEDSFTRLEKSSVTGDQIKDYSCIYVSPLFENRKGAAVQGVIDMEDNSKASRKDAEIQKLKEEVKRLDAETQRFEAEIKRLRLRESEHRRSKQAEIFDKVFFNKVPSSVDNWHHNKVEETINGDFSANQISSLDSTWDLMEEEKKTGNRFNFNDCAPNGIMRVVQGKLAGGKRANKESLISAMEQDGRSTLLNRSTQVPGFSIKSFPVNETASAPMAALHESLEKLCSGFNVFDDGDSILVNESKQSVMGEIQILKRTFCKLVLTCQEQGSKFPGYRMGDGYLVGKENTNLKEFRDFYVNLLSEVARQLAVLNQELPFNFSVKNDNSEITNSRDIPSGTQEIENLKISLDAMSRRLEEEETKNKLLKEKMENEERNHTKALEEHASNQERKEKTLRYSQQLSSQLENEKLETKVMLAEFCPHHEPLVASLENQLKDAHSMLRNLQETADCLAQQLAKCEAKGLAFEQSAMEKDKQLEEAKRRMQFFQSEIDATITEKFELLTKVQQMNKEGQEQKLHITELRNINEELSGCAQVKDEQLASLRKEVTQSQQSVERKAEEIFKLMQDLRDTKREVQDLRGRDEAQEQRYKSIKAKLSHTEYELSQREEALERLTEHLAATIERINPSSRETGEVHTLFRKGGKKEKLADQLKQSWRTIRDLEAKVAHMEGQFSTAKSDISEMKTRSV